MAGLDQQVAARPVAEPKERCGPEEQVALERRLDRRAHGVGDTVGHVRLRGRGEDAHQPPKRRVAERPPTLELALEELANAVLRRQDDDAQLRIPGLDDDPAARVSRTARTARELGQERERALL